MRNHISFLLIFGGLILTACPETESDNFKLKIFFEDLVGFAMVEDQIGRVNEAWAILLDASDPAKLEIANTAKPHKALLEVPREFVQQDGWGSESDGRLLRFTLRGNDLEISAPPTEELSVAAGRRAPGSVEPNGAKEEEDFSWVPDMTDLVPNAHFRAGVLDGSPSQAPPLAARFKLDRGLLKTHKVERDSDQNKPLVYTFSEEFEQAVSHIVVLEIEATGPVTLLSRDMGNPGSEPRKLVLAAPPGGEVGVYLRNSPVSSVDAQDHEESESHFKLFYNLLAITQGVESLPIPTLSKASTDQGLRGGEEACPNVRVTVKSED